MKINTKKIESDNSSSTKKNSQYKGYILFDLPSPHFLNLLLF